MRSQPDGICSSDGHGASGKQRRSRGKCGWTVVLRAWMADRDHFFTDRQTALREISRRTVDRRIRRSDHPQDRHRHYHWHWRLRWIRSLGVDFDGTGAAWSYLVDSLDD